MLGFFKKHWQQRAFHKKLENFVSQGNYSAALEHIDQEVLVHKNQEVELYKIWLMMECDTLDNDPSLLKSMEESHPNHPIVLLLKGEYQFKQKAYAYSKATLEKVLVLDPDNLRAEYSLAKTCLALGEIDRATQLMRSTVQYDPKLVQCKLLAISELLLMKETQQTKEQQ